MSIKPFRRQLVIVNKSNKFIVHTRLETATGNAARVTKELYALLVDGTHIAYYAHAPSKIRVPTQIGKRFYVKPAGWTPKA
jgi:hypothetical protein